MRVAMVVAVALTLLGSRGARADDMAKTAADAFAKAEARFTAGDKAGACPLYEQALANGDDLLPWKNAFLASTKLALCKREAGKMVSAAGLYRRAARLIRSNSNDAANERKAAQADKVATDLDALASHLVINVPPPARVDGLSVRIDTREVPASEWGRRSAIDGGVYRIRASAPGRAPFEQVVTVGREKDVQTVEVPVLAPGKDPQPVPDRPVPPRVPPTATTATGSTAVVRTRSRLPAIIAAGAGAVALIAAGGFELSARSTYSDYEDDPTHPGDLRDDANGKRDIANVLAIAGVVGVGAGVALWFLWPEREAHRPVPTVSGTTVGIQMSF